MGNTGFILYIYTLNRMIVKQVLSCILCYIEKVLKDLNLVNPKENQLNGYSLKLLSSVPCGNLWRILFWDQNIVLFWSYLSMVLTVGE